MKIRKILFGLITILFFYSCSTSKISESEISKTNGTFESKSSNDVRVNENVPVKEHGLIKDKEGAINGKPTYVRVLIKNKRL